MLVIKIRKYIVTIRESNQQVGLWNTDMEFSIYKDDKYVASGPHFKKYTYDLIKLCDEHPLPSELHQQLVREMFIEGMVY